MGFEGLLGNEQLKNNLTSALRQDRISHSYLITGPDGSGKHTLARLLAAAMECTAQRGKPCGVCSQCRKVLNNVHPDVITVDDAEHKTVSVKVVRSAREDLYIRPNEGLRKVYIFPRAGDLGASGENALLKVMEEPPAYGAYILLANSAQQMLPTIRSRCAHLQLMPLTEAVCTEALQRRFPAASQQAIHAAFVRGGGFLGQAAAILDGSAALLPQTAAFAQCYEKKSALALTELLVPMEKMKREQFIAALTQWLELLEAALAVRSGMPAAIEEANRISRSRTALEIMQTIRHLKRALELANGNVSVGTLCGALQVQLR